MWPLRQFSAFPDISAAAANLEKAPEEPIAPRRPRVRPHGVPSLWRGATVRWKARDPSPLPVVRTQWPSLVLSATRELQVLGLPSGSRPRQHSGLAGRPCPPGTIRPSNGRAAAAWVLLPCAVLLGLCLGEGTRVEASLMQDLPLGSLWTRLVVNESASIRQTGPGPSSVGTKPEQPPTSCDSASWRWHGTEEEVFLRHVTFPGPATCGKWGPEYAALHSQMRSKGQAGRYLTFQPIKKVNGLGDRLNGVVAVFLAALVTGRAFLINDPFLEAVFEPAEIDWHVPEGVAVQQNRKSMEEAMKSPRGAVVRVSGISGLPPTLVEQFQGTEAMANIILTAHWGLLIPIFNSPKSRTRKLLYDGGMRLPTAFGCILRLIMRPRREVFEKALPALSVLQRQKMGQPRTCIHIRTSDHVAWKSLDHNSDRSFQQAKERIVSLMESIASCAKAVADWWYPPERNTTWFVMSDSAFIREQLVKQYPQKVVTSGMEALHPKVGGVDGAINSAVDWLLFSMCDYYVQTHSGLSKLAYVYNMQFQLQPLFLFPRMESFHGSYPCNPARPSDIYILKGWSGL